MAQAAVGTKLDEAKKKRKRLVSDIRVGIVADIALAPHTPVDLPSIRGLGRWRRSYRDGERTADSF